MDIKTVKQLAELMTQFGLTEVEFAQENSHIRLSKQGAVPQPVAAIPVTATEQTEKTPAVEKCVPRQTIDSPLVGTFYRASSPDAAPFVTEGSVVAPGTIVCVVEAMKVMNEIKAEKAGVITKILVENDSPVEYGQPMFEITAKDDE